MQRLFFGILLVLIFVTTPIPAFAEADSSEKDVLTEESTYLTFPEWYIVFSAQEYSDFLDRGGKPSQFPYLLPVKSYWETYYKVTKTAIDKGYPFNFGNHLMLGVIGVSFTGEYLAKALHENSIGLKTEALGAGLVTPEDVFANDVAREYGQFLPHTPWYEFPFAEKLIGLWTKTPLLTLNLRSWERKVTLTLEYEFKALYAALIRYASGSVYAPASSEVLVRSTLIPQVILDANPEIKVLEINPDDMVSSLPRYEKFTNIALILLRNDIQFYDLSGNKRILVTAIVNKNWQHGLTKGTLLFQTPIYSNNLYKRIAIDVPVEELGNLINNLEAKNFKVEHLFDY